jgi:hypothetical protein
VLALSLAFNVQFRFVLALCIQSLTVKRNNTVKRNAVLFNTLSTIDHPRFLGGGCARCRVALDKRNCQAGSVLAFVRRVLVSTAIWHI